MLSAVFGSTCTVDFYVYFWQRGSLVRLIRRQILSKVQKNVFLGSKTGNGIHLIQHKIWSKQVQTQTGYIITPETDLGIGLSKANMYHLFLSSRVFHSSIFLIDLVIVDDILAKSIF